MNMTMIMIIIRIGIVIMVMMICINNHFYVIFCDPLHPLQPVVECQRSNRTTHKLLSWRTWTIRYRNSFLSTAITLFQWAVNWKDSYVYANCYVCEFLCGCIWMDVRIEGWMDRSMYLYVLWCVFTWIHMFHLSQYVCIIIIKIWLNNYAYNHLYFDVKRLETAYKTVILR